MQAAANASDLERRKKVRVRLRGDLSITVQKYEGRRYYVVKDPVSLRYFRFKEQEHFLLNYMDGTRTLDEAQKAFEQRFRPDRLTLEDLEGFASQLLQSGLAQNESPQAGKQLYERFKKRRRQRWTAVFLNILYIKLPLYDPDKLLIRMLKPLRFIFTIWFLVLSVAVMATALGLVLSQWNDFIAKLPSFHQFFSMNTVIYLWAALGLVKVIHEFGHGLSCKAFGGEVHEMGALILCLSPCLYCNVSDAWMLPNKWKRIIIGAAGIYVELIIASFATFVWWWTDHGTFINNLCMSLMVVCSVSTVIFNANPLMRFDGYYILADWLEIPNLRERSNRYVTKLFQQYGLGIEIQPEPYMTRSRQYLFVFYAIVSYIYRWVITFSILYFMYTFLKPYKLGTVSFLLGTGAIVSMVGVPIYRLGKALHRRGRIPDMKPARIWLLVGVFAAAVVLVLAIPFPVQVKGLVLIQVRPDQAKNVVAPEVGGFLEQVFVEDGERVQAGQVLAILDNPDLGIKLALNQRDQALRQGQVSALLQELLRAGAYGSRAGAEFHNVSLLLRALKQEEVELKKRNDRLVVRSPREGVVMLSITSGAGLRKEDQGKWVEKGTLLCQIGDPRALRAVVLVEPADQKMVHLKDKAWLRIHGRGYNYWRGTVTEIAAAETKDIPPQLSNKVAGDVPTEQDPQSKAEVPQHQHYLIAIEFDDPDHAIHPGTMGRVKIEAESHTLWWRFYRYLSTAFNVGL